MIRLAVASDLHAVEAGSADSFLVDGRSRIAWKSHPVEALKRLIASEGIEADYLLCPGDFTNKCSLRGLELGWQSVLEVAASLHATPLSTVGNHDLDSRRVHGSDVFGPARALSPS